MAYNLNYTSQFASSEALLNYELNIYKKNYDGDIKDILLGGIPAVQEWQDDDPKKPIKGCTLSVNIINNGVVQLFDFYSNEDDTFLVELKRIETDDTLFIGYLLQSDCQEIQVDYYHQINIVATDNLGLLKDISLSQAATRFGQVNTTYGNISRAGTNSIYFYTFETPPVINVGSIITVNDNNYTVNNVEVIPGSPIGFRYYVVEFVPTFTGFDGDLSWVTPVDLTTYLTYAEIIRLCLRATQLELPCDVYSQLYPIGGDYGRWLDDTFVLGTTFKSGDSWESCYDVLEKIMSRFYASCFQSVGRWVIVRWGELWDRRTSTGAELLGYRYDYDMNYVTDITTVRDFYYGEGSDIEAGFLRSILRPYQYVKETFNYNQPADILVNGNFTDLGALRNEYLVGDITYREYELPSWFNYAPSPGPYPSRFIRVESDSAGQELGRYVVVVGPTWDDRGGIQSSDITISKDDIIDWSFTYRSNNSQPGNVTNIFQVTLTDGTSILYLNNNGQWTSTRGFTYNVMSGDNTNQWHTVSIKSNQVPFNGIITVHLATIVTDTDFESQYKDLSFNVIYSINGSTKIIGHTHKDSQSLTLKNNLSSDIVVDDTPRSTIAGTQFLYSSTGISRDRTTLWQYQTASFPSNIKLGEITTFEELFQRYIPRTKYNGKLLDIHQGADEGYYLSNLAVIKLKLQTDMRYVPGAIAIDYKANTADVTLWEITALGESYSTLNALDLYEFKYLYEKS